MQSSVSFSTQLWGWVCSGRRDSWLDLIKRILCQSQFSVWYFSSLTCCRSTNSWCPVSIPFPPSATSSPPWIFFFDSHPPFSEIGNNGKLSLYQIILLTHVYAELLQGGPGPLLGADFSEFSGQPWQIYWGHRSLRRRRQGGSQPWLKLTHRWVFSGPRTQDPGHHSANHLDYLRLSINHLSLSLSRCSVYRFFSEMNKTRLLKCIWREWPNSSIRLKK